ncbi:MAG: hypothetical protein N4A41_14060 [Crocinitomicaceae bacterium]|jgi:hypothetical protein|nr:hypothetical protein [Crocinitomicaceae bacterium]
MKTWAPFISQLKLSTIGLVAILYMLLHACSEPVQVEEKKEENPDCIEVQFLRILKTSLSELQEEDLQLNLTYLHCFGHNDSHVIVRRSGTDSLNINLHTIRSYGEVMKDTVFTMSLEHIQAKIDDLMDVCDPNVLRVQPAGHASRVEICSVQPNKQFQLNYPFSIEEIFQ